MRYRVVVYGAILAGTLLAAACGGSAGASDPAPAEGSGPTVVGLDTMRFNPETVTVKAGEAVRITFRNTGVLPHDLISEGAERNVKLANVAGGRTASGVFQANKPGTYNVVCIQPGHKEAGMVGKIVVE